MKIFNFIDKMRLRIPKGKSMPQSFPTSLPQNPAAFITSPAFNDPWDVWMSHVPFSLRLSLVTSVFCTNCAPCLRAPIAMACVRE